MKSTVIEFVASTFKAALAKISKDNKGYYKFGEDDKLPTEIIDSVNSSGTARQCVTKIQMFTMATGTQDEALGNQPLNNSQTVNQVISDLSLYIAYAPAVIGRVVFANDGTPQRFYPIQFNKIRRQGSVFVYNENFGYSSYKKSEDIYLTEFEATSDLYTQERNKEIVAYRLQAIAEQLKKYAKQWGQIVYAFNKGMGQYYDVYPIPDYYSGIDDIKSDAQISGLENRNISKGFRTPVIISTGPIDDTNKDENGFTDQDKFDQNVQSFTGEKASSILHLKGETNEQKPAVTTIDIAEILDQTDKVTDRVGRKVCRLFTVPPVIAGFATPGQLGENQELKNSIDLFRLTVSRNQKLISSTLKTVFPDKNFDLTTLKLFDFLPDSVLSKLTDVEIRDIFGLKPPPNAPGQGGV